MMIPSIDLNLTTVEAAVPSTPLGVGALPAADALTCESATPESVLVSLCLENAALQQALESVLADIARPVVEAAPVAEAEVAPVVVPDVAPEVIVRPSVEMGSIPKDVSQGESAPVVEKTPVAVPEKTLVTLPETPPIAVPETPPIAVPEKTPVALPEAAPAVIAETPPQVETAPARMRVADLVTTVAPDAVILPKTPTEVKPSAAEVVPDAQPIVVQTPVAPVAQPSVVETSVVSEKMSVPVAQPSVVETSVVSEKSSVPVAQPLVVETSVPVAQPIVVETPVVPLAPPTAIETPVPVVSPAVVETPIAQPILEADQPRLTPSVTDAAERSFAPVAEKALPDEPTADVLVAAGVAPHDVRPQMVEISTAVPVETVKSVEIVRQVAATSPVQPTDVLLEAAQAVVDTILVSPGLLRGQGEMRIQLRSEVLDGSEIRIAVEGRVLAIEFLPQTVEMATLIERSRPKLEQHLTEHIHQFRIAVDVRRREQKKERV